MSPSASKSRLDLPIPNQRFPTTFVTIFINLHFAVITNTGSFERTTFIFCNWCLGRESIVCLIGVDPFQAIFELEHCLAPFSNVKLIVSVSCISAGFEATFHRGVTVHHTALPFIFLVVSAEPVTTGLKWYCTIVNTTTGVTDGYSINNNGSEWV